MSVPAPIGPKVVFKEMLSTKSGKVGLIMLVGLVLLSMLVPLHAPYDVVKAWNDPRAWVDNPKCAAPEWVEWLTGKKLPRNIVIEPDSRAILKHDKVMGGVYKVMWRVIKFRYDYDEFPNFVRAGFKIALIINSTENVLVNITWIRPDGLGIVLFYDIIPVTGETVPVIKEYTSKYPDFEERAYEFAKGITGKEPETRITQLILFAKAGEHMADPHKAEVLKGLYKIWVRIETFDVNADVEVRFIIFGRVYGWAGTDIMGRDIAIALLWGAPVALAFGLSTSFILAFIHALFGVVAGWLGGRVDEFIQKLTQVFMVIPTFPILVLVSLLYRISIWSVVAVLVALSPVSGATLTVRSMTLQIKEEQYILAAKAYGASGWNMVFKHIFPRVMPYVITNIVTSTPYFVFLEAALSFLGLGDPVLPTWGKLLHTAQASGALFMGWWWWVLLPAGGVAITALAFALLGYSLDKIVNPRLREL